MKNLFYFSLVVFTYLLSGCSPEGTDTIVLPSPPKNIYSGIDLSSDSKSENTSSSSGEDIYDGISSSSDKGGDISSSSKGASSSSYGGNLTGEVPSSVIPDTIREQIEYYMPIYSGTEPPYIAGQYLVSPLELIKSNIPNDGIFVEKFADMYIAFLEHANGIDLSYQSRQGGISESNELVNVVGSNDNFTAYFKSGNISTIISGTYIDTGIYDFHYAFIMLDVNIYRVFEDGDDLAERNSWWQK